MSYKGTSFLPSTELTSVKRMRESGALRVEEGLEGGPGSGPRKGSGSKAKAPVDNKGRIWHALPEAPNMTKSVLLSKINKHTDLANNAKNIEEETRHDKIAEHYKNLLKHASKKKESGRGY